MTTDPTPPEPEIELLRRMARGSLLAIRAVFWSAGACGLVAGVFGPPSWTGLGGQQPAVFVFACVGAPLVVPPAWWLGRGRWLALALALAACLLPMLHEADHRHGYLLRAFGMLIACLTMVVWRALWQLTRAR